MKTCIIHFNYNLGFIVSRFPLFIELNELKRRRCFLSTNKGTLAHKEYQILMEKLSYWYTDVIQPLIQQYVSCPSHHILVQGFLCRWRIKPDFVSNSPSISRVRCSNPSLSLIKTYYQKDVPTTTNAPAKIAK